MGDQGGRLRNHRPILLTLVCLVAWSTTVAQDLKITRLQYGGGGDWYANPSSIPNLINFILNNTTLKVAPDEFRVKITNVNLFDHPYLYMTGHGNVRFTGEEVKTLREFLTTGGFLHADDNYGMNESFRRQMKRVFPMKEWVELPHNHPIFSSYFDFPSGLPKIHEHDGQPPQALALYHQGKIVVLYTYESDLGDGWEDLEVHKDGEDLHLKALKMGTNILVYYLSN